MESDLGKLFIGGISWDTDEDRLREYFRGYGEVVEAVIMRDRSTGRARGFGFVAFADPAVAERVLSEKHSIDGRVVEAKKAVPRDEQHGSSRTGWHGPARPHTKKIFVGGLPSTVTEGVFRKYFDQFGTITDVVVMYDHRTQRPRGFGFVAFDSEDAVDKALQRTFHELDGKMVEAKRAVPKELSPAPATRSPCNPNRMASFLNGYAPAFNSPVPGGRLGPRMDGGSGFVDSGRNGYPPLGRISYGMGVNLELRLPPSHDGAANYTDGIGYGGRTPSPFYNGSPARYNYPIGCGGNRGGSGPRGIWGGGNLDYSASSNGSPNSGNRILLGSFSGNRVKNWGGSTASSVVAQSGWRGSGYANGNLGLGDDIYGEKMGNADPSPTAANGLYEGAYADLYGDPMWSTASKDLDGSTRLSYDLGRNPRGYTNGYNVTNRQSDRGIAA